MTYEANSDAQAPITLTSDTTGLAVSSWATHELDWSKVKTFEDLIAVLSIVEVTVHEGSEMHRKLEKWLKPAAQTTTAQS